MEYRTAASPPAPALEARARPLADVALESIWYRRQVSRAELARQLGISRSTASELVADLLERGLVAEVGDGPSQGGRRPILVEFRDDAHVILGVDMGATHVAVALTDLRGRILGWKEEPHPVRDDPEGARALILRLCETCLHETPLKESALDEACAGDTSRQSDRRAQRPSLLGIGVAVPAPIDHRDPSRLSTEVLPAWRGESGFDVLEARLGAPVFMDNDANLGAVAERWWGAGRGIDHFAYIKLATGIGAGLIIGGEVYRGATHAAGELGHISIDPYGEPCVCGNRGCLVTFVGGEAMVRRARMALAEGTPSTLRRGALTPTRIEDAAMAGDALALRVIREAAHHLGVAIAGLLNVLNPGTVILGGSMARLEDELLSPIREAVKQRTLVSSVAASTIQTSELGSVGIALGASTLVLAEALARPALFPPSNSPPLSVTHP
jgi:predicted NBD/HSP70 family sugar kinase